MYTSQNVSHVAAPARISRRLGLIALAALASVALTVLVLTLTAGNSATRAGSATPSRAPSLSFSLSHIKGLDTASSRVAAAQIMRQSVVNGSGRVAHPAR